MKITLFDDEVMLPDSRGDHMLVQTGIDESISQDGPIISTDVHCVYSVGAKVIDFRKNTESVNLRFEDALLWAVRYAKTIGINDVFAVFSISRSIDPRFIAKLGAVQFNDERRGAGRDNVICWDPDPNVIAVRPPFPNFFPQRRLVVRTKGRKRRYARPERQYFASG